MILQTDRNLKTPIQRYGCYLFALLYVVEKAGLTEPLTAERVNNYYETFLKSFWINENCLVKEPEKILGFFGMDARQVKPITVPVTYVPFEGEIEILCYQMPSYSHFVVGDGKGGVEFDPYGASPAVKQGKLVSKRIFRVTQPVKPKRDNRIA